MSGNPLFEELLWVHSMLRRDLELVEQLARRVAGGLDPAELRDELDSLRSNGPLFRLKVNCLHYCRFVHHHHRLEDVAIFPALRRMDPELGPAVDRLESEHREVAVRLRAVEDAAEALDAEGDGDGDPRAAVVRGLESLGEALLAHLEFEELSLEPALARMQTWRG